MIDPNEDLKLAQKKEQDADLKDEKCDDKEDLDIPIPKYIEDLLALQLFSPEELADPKYQYIITVVMSLKSIIQSYEEVKNSISTFIIVPRDPHFDSLVEQKVKTQLLCAHKVFITDSLAMHNKTLDLLINFIKYCLKNAVNVIFDPQLLQEFLAKITYMTTGVRTLDPFGTSVIKQLKNSLDTQIDFETITNSLFQDSSRRKDMLKNLRDECETLNFQFKNSIKLFLKRFDIITALASKDSISPEQCGKWLDAILGEITSKQMGKVVGNQLKDFIQMVSPAACSPKKSTSTTELPPPHSQIPMTTFTKPAINIPSDIHLPPDLQEAMKTFLQNIDLSEATQLFTFDNGSPNTTAKELFLNSIIKISSDVLSSTTQDNLAAAGNDRQMPTSNTTALSTNDSPPVHSLPIFETRKSKQADNEKTSTAALLSNNIQHTLLPPPSPLKPPTQLETNQLHQDAVEHSTELNRWSNTAASIRQDP